ncbi:class I SAM-dependent methyltransferase [archaeon]|jgi:2-polyprenyl-3-methyl-5-hydroxy-6-metoxy-1,4-benzoquinol methylase|nr:class I SAM-dependent methyltransferase [archaeon]MBT4023049.1 class I SAM-dependent methyltransferase [archaeon]MBT4272448.1 class I SAM-dependent methyltransferase [archaeon]MBT4460546.1 class I SAM-dependent methyltransferase [archaeon]MBT4857864.1 class I SAM-dependent methyltransferase [archaeon]
MKCPVCKEKTNKKFLVETSEANSKNLNQAYKCENCNLIFLENYKEDRKHIYGENYMVWGQEFKKNEKQIILSKRESFSLQLSFLKTYIKPQGKKLLDIGTGKGYLLDVAKKQGYNCYGLDISKYATKIAKKNHKKIFTGDLFSAKYKSNYFDVITATDLLEHIENPHEFVKEVRRILKPGGYFFVITPNTDSFTRKILGKKWYQYKYEHIIYYNKSSIKELFEKYDFKIQEISLNKKRFNFAYYSVYFRKYSLLGLEKIFLFFYDFLPQKIKTSYFNNFLTGELLLIAKK